MAVLMPRLTQAAANGMRHAAVQSGIGFNSELVNQEASPAARQYTDELLVNLGSTSERIVGQAITQWIQEPNRTMGDLVGFLKPHLEENAYRTDLIAVTEVTRAYSHGNKIAYQQVSVQQWRWRTNRDELVCEICGGLNKVVKNIGEPFTIVKGKAITEPPAHPGCRCWITPVVDPKQSLQPRQPEDIIPIGMEQRKVKMYQVGNVRLSVPVDLDPSKQIISKDKATQMIGDLLGKLPEKYRDVISEVRLSDMRNSVLEAQKEIEYGVPKGEGYIPEAINPKNQAVTFYENSQGSEGEIREYAAHEIGHGVAFRLFGQAEPLDMDAWREAIVADGEFPSWQAMKDQAEDWSATFGLYLVNPEEAAKSFPHRVKLIRDWAYD